MPLIRSICIALLGLSLLTSAARAGDYVVAWAFAAHGENEMGTRADCEYRTYCIIKVEKFGFEVMISFWRSGHGAATIDITSGISCCYFSDGESSVKRGTSSLIRLGVFEGRARRGNEFVLNSRVGDFYLLFSALK